MFVCIQGSYNSQFGSFCRKAEAWELLRFKPSHALPPSLSHDMTGSQRVSTSLATVCRNYLMALHSPDLSPCPNAEFYNTFDVPPWKTVYGTQHESSSRNHDWGTERSILDWHEERTLGAEDMCALPRKHAHCGTLARLKLSSQGMWTVKEHHLPSRPLVPHLCMTSWHRQIFCALAVSRQFSCLAEISGCVRPNSA